MYIPILQKDIGTCQYLSVHPTKITSRYPRSRVIQTTLCWIPCLGEAGVVVVVAAGMVGPLFYFLFFGTLS